MTVSEIKQLTAIQVMNRPDMLPNMDLAVRMAHHDLQTSVFIDPYRVENYMEWPFQYGTIRDIPIAAGQSSVPIASLATGNRKIKRVVNVRVRMEGQECCSTIPRTTYGRVNRQITWYNNERVGVKHFAYYTTSSHICFTHEPDTNATMEADVVYVYGLPGDNEEDWLTINVPQVLSHRAAFYGFIWTGEASFAAQMKAVSEEMAIQALKSEWRNINSTSILPGPGDRGNLFYTRHL